MASNTESEQSMENHQGWFLHHQKSKIKWNNFLILFLINLIHWEFQHSVLSKYSSASCDSQESKKISDLRCQGKLIMEFATTFSKFN